MTLSCLSGKYEEPICFQSQLSQANRLLAGAFYVAHSHATREKKVNQNVKLFMLELNSSNSELGVTSMHMEKKHLLLP